MIFFQIYHKDVLLQYTLDTLSKTNMIDYIEDIYSRQGEALPEELVQRRATVLAKLLELRNEAAPMMKCMEELKKKEMLKDSKALVNILQQEFQVYIVNKSINYRKVILISFLDKH